MKITFLFFMIFIHANLWAIPNLPKEFKLSFKQKVEDITSQGSILYKYPSYLRMEITEPDQNIFISIPQKAFFYTPPFIPTEKGTLRYIQDDTQGEIFRYFVETRKSSPTIQVVDTGKTRTLKFSEKLSQKLAVSQVVMVFAAKDKKEDSLQELKVFKNNGQILSYEITEFKAEKVDPSSFKFQIPENTEIFAAD